MRQIRNVFCILILSFPFALACDDSKEGTPPKENSLQEAADRVGKGLRTAGERAGEVVKEAADEARDLAHEAKKEIKEIKGRIDDRGTSPSATVETREQYETRVESELTSAQRELEQTPIVESDRERSRRQEEVNERMREAGRRLEALKQASKEKWDQLKVEMEDSLRSAREAVRSFREGMKEEQKKPEP